jgi:hypothetical protein
MELDDPKLTSGLVEVAILDMALSYRATYKQVVEWWSDGKRQGCFWTGLLAIWF